MSPSPHIIVAQVRSLGASSDADSTTRRTILPVTVSGPLTRYAYFGCTVIRPPLLWKLIDPVAAPGSASAEGASETASASATARRIPRAGPDRTRRSHLWRVATPRRT